jgi:hypothetical protein
MSSTSPALPVVGERYVVTADGSASGLRHYYDLGEVVECISLDVVSASYARHADAAEFKATKGGKRQTVRLVDLKVHVPDPEVHTFAPGDRAVVTGTVFHRYVGGMGDHADYYHADSTRPKVGDVVTVTNGWTIPGNVGIGNWTVAAECLVPAPKFVPGDRVSIVSSTYVGVYRKAGNVGTVVPMPSDRHDISGISRPDYAVVLDGNGSRAWGYREAELALLTVEPAPAYVPSKGDRVLVGDDFTGSDKYAGLVGTVTEGPDREGDFVVEFPGEGQWSYFPASSLSKAPVGPWATLLSMETPEVETVETAPSFAVGDRVTVLSSPFAAEVRGPGATGTVTALRGYGQGRGDYAVKIDGDYSLQSWGFEREELAAYVPTFEVGDRVRIAANILPSGKPGLLGDSIVGEEHTVRHVGEDHLGRLVVTAGYRLAPQSFVKIEAPAPEPEVVEAEVVFEDGDKVLVTGPTECGLTDYEGRAGQVKGGLDSDGDYHVEFEDGDYDYFKPSSLAPAPEVKGATPTFEVRDETAPEDYALRLEVSAQASDILAKSGFRGILGSDVAALAEFLLGLKTRS